MSVDSALHRRRSPAGMLLRSGGGSGGEDTNRWSVTAHEPELETEIAGPHLPVIGQLGRLSSAGEYEGEDVDLLGGEKVKRSRGGGGGGEQYGFLRSLKSDWGSIGLLLFLYLLQGIPLGLIGSIPLVLQSRHVTYAQQAVFSFAYWPFSVKVLWAPIVDSVYSRWLGRRKSWLVPTQYLIGLFMLLLSYHVDYILGKDDAAEPPNVIFLTMVFLPLNFLAATQDVAVDGWALTMLSKRNVGYASTCNAVGQTAGYFIGNVVFLSLESAEFCNRFLRAVPQNRGVISLADFMFFWAVVFISTTTLVLFFKKEVNNRLDDETSDEIDKIGIVKAYKLCWNIIRLKPVMSLIVVLLTAKVAFAATDGITGLKLIQLGLPKDKLAGLAVFLMPIQIALPWLLGKYTAGPRPLDVYLKAYPFRIFMGFVFAFLVWWTPSWKDSDGHFPALYFAICVSMFCLHQVATYSIFVSMMAFSAQVSDPLVGGTYMTLLNTLNNLGGNWPVTVVLSLVDKLTWANCQHPDRALSEWSCSGGEEEKNCTNSGGVCQTSVDGYYLLVFLCTLIGLFWWRLMRRRMDQLQNYDKREWSCPTLGNLRR